VVSAPATGGIEGPEQVDAPLLPARRYREIRSARYPLGLPDRSDETVLEAFDGMWLLIDHSPGAVELAGLADDYEVARAWLNQGGEDDGPDQG
jgi:hypothetical protein